jgi:hypothetical protein
LCRKQDKRTMRDIGGQIASPEGAPNFAQAGT